jgi:hypothetical protein
MTEENDPIVEEGEISDTGEYKVEEEDFEEALAVEYPVEFEDSTDLNLNCGTEVFCLFLSFSVRSKS